jgi:peptidoglycan/LPS O-acetylase OafA/YrhL
LTKEMSIYLDAVRFLAAISVFACHVSGSRLTGGLFWQMGPYGGEAVDVFFVLSGFVIAYTYDMREGTLLRYATSRFARIYSVAIPALTATFVLDAIGRASRPHLYNASWHYVWHGRISQLLHGLAFTNQIWFNNLPPGSDFPFWSLGFEVWYYAIFAAAVFAPARWRIPVILMLLIVVGPKIAIMLPIWLMGVLAYHVGKRIAVPLPVAAICFVGSIMAWCGYEYYAWHIHRLIGQNWTGRPPIIQDYIIGSLFFVQLVGFRFFSYVFGSLLNFFGRPIRWVAGSTLTLYLFHMPLSQFFAAETPWAAASWKTRLLIYGGVPVLALIIAEATERRKKIWRLGFETLFQWIGVTLGRKAGKPQTAMR